MRSRISRRTSMTVAIFLVVSLVAANILLSLHYVATNVALYRNLWDKYDVPANAGMIMEDLSQAGDLLVAYFTGEKDSPQLLVTISKEQRCLYNAKELKHLQDVRSLFQIGLTAEWLSIASAFLSAAILISTSNHKLASRAFYAASGLCLLVIAVAATAAHKDFTEWWTHFHLMTFTNKLWLLDPSTDWLIKMFPEEFFFSMVKRVGLHSGATSLAFLIGGFFLGRKSKRAKTS